MCFVQCDHAKSQQHLNKFDEETCSEAPPVSVRRRWRRQCTVDRCKRRDNNQRHQKTATRAERHGHAKESGIVACPLGGSRSNLHAHWQHYYCVLGTRFVRQQRGFAKGGQQRRRAKAAAAGWRERKTSERHSRSFRRERAERRRVAKKDVADDDGGSADEDDYNDARKDDCNAVSVVRAKGKGSPRAPNHAVTKVATKVDPRLLRRSRALLLLLLT